MDIKEISPEERRALQDFETSFRSEFSNLLGKLDDLPYDLRMATWGQLQNRFRQYQDAITKQEGKTPDFDDPAVKDKHKDLVKSPHLDADQIAQKALKAQSAKDLADDLKARGAGANRDQDRER